MVLEAASPQQRPEASIESNGRQGSARLKAHHDITPRQPWCCPSKKFPDPSIESHISTYRKPLGQGYPQSQARMSANGQSDQVTKTQHPDQFFQAIGNKVEDLAPATNGADTSDDRPPVEEIESLCMNCGKNGITRLLLTVIPYFREVVIMSFACEHCGLQNNEIQAAGTVQPKGTHYELRLTHLDDFQRQVVKSDTATVKFIELDLEIPAGRGQLTNVEGLLMTVVDDLELGQEARKEQSPEVYPKIAEIIAKGRAMLLGDAFPFRVFVDDPAGNSFIAPDLKDGVGKWEKREFLRTPEQNAALGLADSAADPDAAVSTQALTADGEIIPDEVYSFPATCPGCMHPCTTHMKMVDIPHFKQVVIMSTVCDACGYRSNDVKTGGEIPEQGEKIILKVEDATDLARDILKSETCALQCPELRLEVNPGTLGGRFTTVEGLLTQVRNDLHSQIFEANAHGGDSLASDQRAQWDDFFGGLDAAIKGDKIFTVILTDPFASSFVQPLVDPPAPDPKIQREKYDRTEEEEEELGLKDMKVENYEEPKKEGEAEPKV
uniref:Zinc finger ZPR1-type domain-containing protein n=1 Tax=Bionectria ochroleuca TaxID=29856 RepID=A0A8H7NDI5_BIOOC